jgi:ATP-dependent Lon protease
MNPVFYFDELDKVSETPKGEEIINSLIHLTDATQNNQYADKYFNGIEFDLSKSLFIFSYNDITKINPILLDRLICIKTDKFELEDKIHIAKNYLLREIYEQLKIKEDAYKIEDEDIKYIIETHTGEEGGVRTLKKHLYNIFSKFNLLNLTKNDDSIKYTFDLEEELLENKVITKEIIDIFIKDKSKKSEEIDDSIKHWYM